MESSVLIADNKKSFKLLSDKGNQPCEEIISFDSQTVSVVI